MRIGLVLFNPQFDVLFVLAGLGNAFLTRKALSTCIKVELVKLNDPDAVVDPESEGAVKLSGEPQGKVMGWAKLGRGHMCILPVGSAYRVISDKPATAIFQTVEGKETIQRWAEICKTESLAAA